MSLRASPERFHVVGVSSNPYELVLSNADENYLVPMASDPAFIPILGAIINKTKAQFLHSQHDAVIKVLAVHAKELPVKLFLPSATTVASCVDKYKSFLRWKKAGVPVAQTRIIKTPRDLALAFDEFGSGMWIRLKEGGGGAGALPVDDLTFARAWIVRHRGWGNFIASERLSPASITWSSIWRDGTLVVAQTRKRHYWLFANRTLSGVTGVTGAGETVRDHAVDELAMAAIKAIDAAPNGIFSVDMTYDTRNNPRATEINIGRFFTTIHFFTAAGLNMPYIYVKLAFGESVPPIHPTINPLKPGLLWVRGMDTAPVLTETRTIKAYQKILDQLKKRI